MYMGDQMPKVVYSGSQLSLSYSEMIVLRQSGKLNLGIDELVALRLADLGIHPKGSASAAFYFFKLLAVGAFALGMYWAFTSAWWWGLIGVVVMAIIWSGNKTGHAENLLDAAMRDAHFYERVRELNGWRYQIDDDIAAHLSKK